MFLNSRSRHYRAKRRRTCHLMRRVGLVAEVVDQTPLRGRGLDGRGLGGGRLTINRCRRLGQDCLSLRALVRNEGIKLSIVVEVIIVVIILQLFKVDLVTEETADATKALHELVALG